MVVAVQDARVQDPAGVVATEQQRRQRNFLFRRSQKPHAHRMAFPGIVRCVGGVESRLVVGER